MKLLLCILYIAALGILAHVIGEKLPRSRFRSGSRPFSAFAWEDGGRFYERLRIRKWKDRLPDMSRLCPDMVKKKVTGATDAAALEKLICETCVAEAVHAVLFVLSFGCAVIWPSAGGWLVSAAAALLGNLPYIVIQRYNRPRLVKLLARMEQS